MAYAVYLGVAMFLGAFLADAKGTATSSRMISSKVWAAGRFDLNAGTQRRFMIGMRITLLRSPSRASIRSGISAGTIRRTFLFVAMALARASLFCRVSFFAIVATLPLCFLCVRVSNDHTGVGSIALAFPSVLLMCLWSGQNGFVIRRADRR